MKHLNRRTRSCCMILLALSAMTTTAAKMAGSSACRGCHAEEHSAWLTSHHHTAMLPAGPAAVAGDFDNVQVEFHGTRSRFFREESRYLIETLTDKGRETVEVKYTFGVEPLQQYLVEREGGHLQALNLAWDNRPNGQKWFHLRDDMDSDSPFFWTRHLQNWNARCSDCHSTGLQKNYDPSKGEYQTYFSESNVACEACHGPGSDHVDSAMAGDPPAKLFNISTAPAWQFEPGKKIARPLGQVDRTYLDMCGGCHARRSVVGKIEPGNSFSAQYDLSLLDEGLYHADGQINEEVFVLGSFLQSKMFARGVTCMNCHSAHTGEVKIQGNGLCSQCHRPSAYDAARHTRHEPGVAMCVDCHMPPRTYMKVDDRRDHRFGIPDPSLSKALNTPNACEQCHEDEVNGWNDTDRDAYASLLTKARRLDASVVNKAAVFIRGTGNAPIKRGTLLANLPLTRPSINLAAELTTDPDNLVRRGAVRLLSATPPGIRVPVLTPLLDDPSTAVRLAAAEALVEFISDLRTEDARQLISGIGELRSSFHLDTPAGMSRLGMLELNMGREKDAIDALERALEIESYYVPALLNLADILRARSDDSGALELLARAVSVAPDSGAANHSYGLGLIRMGNVGDAITYLEAATEQSDSNPRYAYVLAVALDSVGRTADAVEILQKAADTWPGQSELVRLMATYKVKNLPR